MRQPVIATLDEHPWRVLTGTVASVAVVWVVVPTGDVTRATLASVVALVMAAAVASRVVRSGWLRVSPWSCLLVAGVLYGVVSPLWEFDPLLAGRPRPFPSWYDAAYLLSYVAAATFLLQVIRRREHGSGGVARPEVVALVDASILAVAATALLWVAQPTTVVASLSPWGAATSIAYLALTGLLAGLALRLLTADPEHRVLKTLVLLWIGGELAGTVVFNHLVASGTPITGHPVNLAWLVSRVSLTLLVLHPRLDELVAARGRAAPGTWRIWMPLGAALVPLAVLLADRSLVTEALAVVAIVLNVARLRLLAGDLTANRRITRELAASVDELEHANQRLENFAAVVSHDLRSPLATVHTTLQTIRTRSAERLTATDTALLDRARGQTTRLLQTIEGLLTLARADQASLAFAEVDLDELVADIVVEMAPDLREIGAVVDHADLPTVTGDDALLRVLVRNLLSNAVRYREPARPLVITVQATRRDDATVLEVRDNGRGIDPDDRDRIFALFARTTDRAADGPKIDGSGIGLATCRRIVEQHGGTIVAEPLDLGTAFVITLPDATSEHT